LRRPRLRSWSTGGDAELPLASARTEIGTAASPRADSVSSDGGGTAQRSSSSRGGGSGEGRAEHGSRWLLGPRRRSIAGLLASAAEVHHRPPRELGRHRSGGKGPGSGEHDEHAASTTVLPDLRLLSQSWICGGARCWSTAAADSEPAAEDSEPAATALPRPPSLPLSQCSSGLLPLPPLFSGVAARPGGAARQLGCRFRLLAHPEAGTAGPRRRGVCRSSRTTPGMASGGRNWMVPSRIPSPAAAILPLKATWRWLCGCGPGPQCKQS
jgi:hypothetical protein